MIKPGDILNNRYKILSFDDEKFYKGDGMGVLYLALDSKTNQKVILKKGWESHEVYNLGLNNEIALLRKLHHHGIPAYIDDFPVEDAMVLVIQLVEGENLEEVLNRTGKPIAFENLLNWGIELLDILDYLHKFTPPIIHRDIKPRNIMLDKDGLIKLIDFGISKDSLRTRIGGKSPWSPPEQFYDWGGTTERSDIYSVGATLYLLATKHLALPSKYRVQVMRDKLPDPLPSIYALNSNIPVSFSKIIMTAMEIDPDRRFQSALEMKRELLEERNSFVSDLPKTEPSLIIQSSSASITYPSTTLPVNFETPVLQPSLDSKTTPVIHQNFSINTSELEQIKLLESKKTNFIFMFGQVNSGKTAIIASLMRYLNSECRFGKFEKKGIDEDLNYGEFIENRIKQRLFPDRNAIGNIFQISGSFIPNTKYSYLESLDLTFLDMSGAELTEINSHSSVKFLPYINNLFKSGKLSLTFILVVPVEDLKENDRIMRKFLDFIRKNLPTLKDDRILLLISKWDKSTKMIPLEYLLKFEMPETFAELNPNLNSYGNFTLGKIYEEKDEMSFIQNYNSASAENVFRWIYFALTKKRIS